MRGRRISGRGGGRGRGIGIGIGMRGGGMGRIRCYPYLSYPYSMGFYPRRSFYPGMWY